MRLATSGEPSHSKRKRNAAFHTPAESGVQSAFGSFRRSKEPEAEYQQLQQTGRLFRQRQQVQPALHMVIMHSQQAWIIAQQCSSPLVQVMQKPSSVISHLHIPIIKLQQQTIIPFIIMQQLHMPPAIMVQRFCIIVADILSSDLHVIFMPPLHFSIFIVHRGTIIQ
jgi:hypothetical protein